MQKRHLLCAIPAALLAASLIACSADVDEPAKNGTPEETVTLSLTVKGTKPAETPEEPGEEEPAGTELCPFCGNAHGGFFGRLIAFFHRALLFFRNLKDKIC